MMALTLIPCYFLSIAVEGRWLRRKLSPELSRKALHIAHLASYSFLLAQVFSRFPMPLLDYARFFSLTWTGFLSILGAFHS